MAKSISVIGLNGSDLTRLEGAARSALLRSDLIVGGKRHLAAFSAAKQAGHISSGSPCFDAPMLELATGLDVAVAELRDWKGDACVLASGDPGFFGVVRLLGEAFGPQALEVHPAPSSISLAFARLGLSWDDAAVISAHGRPLNEAINFIAQWSSTTGAAFNKVAVLCSPESSPQIIASELLKRSCEFELVALCSALGSPEELVFMTTLVGLAQGEWDPVSVLIFGVDPLVAPHPRTAWLPPHITSATGGWGTLEDEFEHREGMITKAEIRAIVLGKLALFPGATIWDVGAGSGSVAIECARLFPDAQVIAIEKRPDDVARIRKNCESHRVGVRVVQGCAPEIFSQLPSPDRCFLGGGGIDVLEAVLRALKSEGRVVATYASMEHACLGGSRLGSLEQISVSRAALLPDKSWRLAAENPVFIAWGPKS